MVLLEHQDLQEQTEQQDLVDLQVAQVPLDLQEQTEQQDLRDLLDLLVALDLQELQDYQV
jgi:hypothetical protein